MKNTTINPEHEDEYYLNGCINNGNMAIALGNMDECIKWYRLGLAQARKLKNELKEKEISLLLITLF